MENEQSTTTTQNKIDSLLQQLETNGEICEDLATDIPAVIAAISDDEALGIVTAFRGFHEMLKNHDDAARLFRYLTLIFECDATRRTLMENIEIGQLEKLSEL